VWIVESSVHFSRLALLGVGYMGGSAALAARRAGLLGDVVGYDPNASATEAALRMGVIDSAAANAAEAVRGATLVLLAAPVRSAEGLLREIATTIAGGATVIDVGSVKGDVVRAAAAILSAGQFVGCHPMAGAEFSGVEAADGDIYPGRVCFICPGKNTRAAAVDATQSFWRGIGCQTLTIEPETHDRLMAAQSHLPHVAAFALAKALAPSLSFLDAHATPASPTTSLRDTTRIAASGPAIWRDILLANASHVLPLIEQLEESVREIRRAVAAADGPGLEKILAAAQECRRRLVEE
jgi:prephenate dehydrogenase